MKLLRKGVQTHAKRLKTAASESVLYCRGDETVRLDAVPGKPVFDQAISEAEFSIQTGAIPWIIKADELILGGLQTEPRRGDHLIAEDGSVWDVLSGTDTTTHAFMDGGRAMMRVYTVRSERSYETT